MNDFGLSWQCHICGRERPDEFISVYSTDLSAEHDMQHGTFKQNVRYCNDNATCIVAAQTYRFLKNDPKTKSNPD